MTTPFDPTRNAPKSAPPKNRASGVGYALPSGELCYDVGTWSSYLYGQETIESPTLDHVITKARERPDAETTERLFGEVYARLYDFDVRKLEEPRAHAKEWAPKLHEIAQNTDSWAKLEEQAKGDSYVSALATAAIADVLLQNLPPLPKDPQQMNDELEGLEQMQRRAKGKKRKRIEKAIANVKAQLEANAYAAEHATKFVNANEGVIELQVEKAIRSVLVESQAAEDALDAFTMGEPESAGSAAGKGPGSPERLALRRVMADQRLRNLAELAGRFRSTVRASKKTKAHGPEEIESVELGDDLKRLLPMERAQLASGGLASALVYARMLDRGAQQYAVKSVEQRTKGPIVFALDESGSMRAKCGGYDRITWAKAVALALMERCIIERRSFAIVHFADGVERVDEFPKPWTTPITSVLDAMGHFANGGTNIKGAVIDSVLLARSVGKWTQGDADVVLVTDGCDGSASDITPAELREVPLHSLGIGAMLPSRLEAISSSTVTYSDAELAGGVLPEVALAS